MARVVAVVARKGGCGKTSLAASLAAVSVSKTFHSVMVDLDSQANASRWALGRGVVGELGSLQSVAALAVPPVELIAADYPPLATANTRADIVEIVRSWCVHESAQIPGLYVIPNAPHIHAETVPDLVLSELPFDTVYVDTPPDISTPAVRAVLRQADAVVSPVVCEPWAVDATEYLVAEIGSVGRRDLVDSGRVRFVINQRQKCAIHDKLEKALRSAWGDLVSRVVIARSVAIAEAAITPELLTKKNPLWKAATAVLTELDTVSSNREAA